MINALCPKNIYLSVKQTRKLHNFIFGDDLDFYEEFTIHLSDEEQEKFFDAKVFSCGPGCGIIFKTD